MKLAKALLLAVLISLGLLASPAKPQQGRGQCQRACVEIIRGCVELPRDQRAACRADFLACMAACRASRD